MKTEPKGTVKALNFQRYDSSRDLVAAPPPRRAPFGKDPESAELRETKEKSGGLPTTPPKLGTAEALTFNQEVMGSNPIALKINGLLNNNALLTLLIGTI